MSRYLIWKGLELACPGTDHRFANSWSRENTYKNYFKRWQLRKATEQHRPCCTPKPGIPYLEEWALPIRELDLHLHMSMEIPRPLAPNRYSNHEVALASVDTFIYSIFDNKGGGWSADISNFIAQGAWPDNGESRWKTVCDRGHAVSSLIRVSANSKAESAFEQLLYELETSVDYLHPAFISEIWRLCLQMLGADGHIQNANAMKRMLEAVRNVKCKNKSIQGSIYRLFSSLCSIYSEHRSDIVHAIRICFAKTITTMTELIGDENIMVLNMVTFYCKFFDAPFILRNVLLAKLNYVRHQIHFSHPQDSYESILIEYTYVNAAYYIFDMPYVAKQTAESLRDRVGCRLSPHTSASWTIEPQVFSFCSKILAEIYRTRAKNASDEAEILEALSKCVTTMRNAIDTLQRGSVDWQIRAAEHSNSLSRWLRDWNLKSFAEEEWKLSLDIVSGIPGKLCYRCIRARYCWECAPRIRAGAQQKSGCPFCKEHKMTWLCQKCTLRQKSPVYLKGRDVSGI